jgi:hypothetical protein
LGACGGGRERPDLRILTCSSSSIAYSAHVSRSSYTRSIRRTRREVLRASLAASVGALAAACGGGGKAADGPRVIDGAAEVNTTGAVPGSGSTPEIVGVAGQQVRISFNYVASGGGRIHNPYVAVWVEDGNKAVVRTIALSIQSGKGLKWLRDLKQWYRVDRDRQAAGGADIVATVSSATRPPGLFEFVWDGLDDAGRPAAAGAYTLFIEVRTTSSSTI